jgi:hypothetical protein
VIAPRREADASAIDEVGGLAPKLGRLAAVLSATGSNPFYFHIDMSRCEIDSLRMELTEPSLADLAAASGLLPRTIRSWVAQGLLPAPLTRGPAARYPAEC